MSTRKTRSNPKMLDAHNDGLILRESRGEVMDFAPDDSAYHADLRRMRKGGIGCSFVMVGDSDLRQSLRLIDAVHVMCAAHPKEMALCLGAENVRRAMRSGRLAIVMTIEGQTMFARDIRLLRNWHRLGVRLASLTHGEGRDSANALQVDASHFGCLTAQERETLRRQTKGLTAFARESLGVMAELHIPCDVAHANDAAFWEVLESARGPVCYTHGGCYALCPHSRNLTDEMMKALAQRGGVMGLCFYSAFIAQQNATLDALVEHFLHALEVMGPECVGIGSDFDGLPRHQWPIIEDASRIGRLWEALERKGVNGETLERIAHKNFLRLLPE